MGVKGRGWKIFFLKRRFRFRCETGMGKVINNFTLVYKIFLYLLPILGVTGVAIPLIFGQNNLSLLGMYLAIPMILAPIIYLKQSKHETSFKSLDSKFFLFFVSVYFFCVFISIFLLKAFDLRPVIYYLVVAVMSGLILAEILFFDLKEKETSVILLQMVILVADLIWGVTLNYSFFIGRTDPIGHAQLIENLINTAHITEIFGLYKPFPLWHILCTFVNDALKVSLSAQKIMFFTNGLIYSFIPPLTYLISIKIFNDRKISLLSALFVSLYPEVVLYGMQSISRSVVSFLELMLILVLLDSNNSKKVFTAVILVFSSIVYHTASMPFVLFILLAIYVLERVFTDEKKEYFLPLHFIALAVSMTLVYWLYYATELFGSIVNLIQRSAPSGTMTKSIIYTPLSELFNYLQYSPLLLFVIIGFFAALKSKKISTLGKNFCIFGLFAVSFTFPGPSLLLDRFSQNLNIIRFGEYTFLFIGIAGAIGFSEIYNKSKKYTKLIPIILFIMMVFLSVSNDFTASDNPLVKRPFYTFYLTDGEETAFAHVASITQGYIMSDYVTTRYLSFSKYKNTTHILEVDISNMTLLRSGEDDVFLIRNSELRKRPLKLYSASSEMFILNPSWESNFDYYYKDVILWADLRKYNKIYDSECITGYK